MQTLNFIEMFLNFSSMYNIIYTNKLNNILAILALWTDQIFKINFKNYLNGFAVWHYFVKTLKILIKVEKNLLKRNQEMQFSD